MLLAIIVVGAGLALLPRPAGFGLELGPSSALAASPTASAASGDTRTAGEGPGIVGSPVLAIAGVLGVGLVAAFVTLVYVRIGAQAGDKPGGSRGARARPEPPASPRRH